MSRTAAHGPVADRNRNMGESAYEQPCNNYYNNNKSNNEQHISFSLESDSGELAAVSLPS